MGYALVFRRYAPFESFGFGFEGDNRSAPSTCLTATARTIGMVAFSPGHVHLIRPGSSGTYFVGAGARIRQLLGRHCSKVTSSVTVSTMSIDCLRFTAQTAGANPMVPAPTIDTLVDIAVTFRRGMLAIEGSVRGDDFPNAEVFIVDSCLSACLLYAFETNAGRNTGPFTRLWGDHREQRLGEFCHRIATDEVGRFRKRHSK
jgi:hypothetical protein